MSEVSVGSRETGETYFGKIQAMVKEAVGFGPVIVYYPGIGGGEEQIDPIGPFADISADEVYGVDIFDQPFSLALLERKLAVAEGKWRDYASSLNAQRVRVTSGSRVWSAEFLVEGKRKTLEIPKEPIDATVTVPSKHFQVIYTKRAYTLVQHLPGEVMQNARAIFDVEQYREEAKITEQFGLGQGFRSVDLSRFPQAKNMLGSGYSPGVVRLSVK